MKLTAQLRHPHYFLAQRLRLFDALVAPRALFRAAAWNMIKRLQQQLNITHTHQKMLRMVLDTRRNPDVDWVTYMHDSTNHLLRWMAKHHVDDRVAV